MTDEDHRDIKMARLVAATVIITIVGSVALIGFFFGH